MIFIFVPARLLSLIFIVASTRLLYICRPRRGGEGEKAKNTLFDPPGNNSYRRPRGPQLVWKIR